MTGGQPLLCVVIVLLLTACIYAADGPAKPTERTLLLDRFDAPFTPDGSRTTTPSVIASPGDIGGGRPMEGGEFVEGKFGHAFRFHDVMKMVYPAEGNINLSAGAVELWVSYNFDPAARDPVPGLNVSNQFFFTVFGPERSSVCVYSVLDKICMTVRNRSRQIVLYQAFAAPWKQGDWHHISLRWGKQMELWCDGQQRTSEPWNGLFGPINAEPEDLRMQLGTWVGYSGVAAEFAVDELHILGPGGEQVPDHPLLTVPFTEQPPTIDGDLSESEWAGAVTTTGFVGLNDPEPVEDQTIAHLAFDDTHLYIGLELTDPQKRPVVGNLAQRDSAVYTEDAFDIFLRPDPESYPYYMLSANAIGTRFDILRREPGRDDRTEPGFDPGWTVETSLRDEGGWYAEAEIPFADLNLPSAPADGERWRANICRDADSASRLSSWSYTDGNFHRTANFGELVFNRSRRAVSLSQFEGFQRGDITGRVDLEGIEFQPIVSVTRRLLDADAKPVVDETIRLMDFRAVRINPPPLSAGSYELTITAQSEDGPELYYQRLPFTVKKPFDVTADIYPYEGKLWARFDTSGLDEAVTALQAELRHGEDVLGTCELGETGGDTARASIDISELAPGDYELLAKAVGADGLLAEARAKVTHYPRPPFWHSDAGIDHTIPEPWTPVETGQEGSIRVWGRDYRCGSGALPEQIISQDRELLARPVSLHMQTGEEEIDIARIPADFKEAPRDRAIRTGSADLGDLSIACTTTVEFDGMLRCDVTLSPKANAVTIDRLELGIPIAESAAQFMLPTTGRHGSVSRIEEEWSAGFHPSIFVCDDDVGLAWFAESDRYWQPKDDRMLAVEPDGESVILSANMIRTPQQISEPVTITFGLQATPVKAIPKNDPFAYHFGGVKGGFAPDRDPAEFRQYYAENLTYPVAANISYERGTLEFFLSPGGLLGSSIRDVVHLPGGFSLKYQSATTQKLQLSDPDGKTAEADNLPLDVGKFTHVAVTWDEVLRLYVAGEKVAEMEATELQSPEADALLTFGVVNPYRGYTCMGVDEIRISDTVRYTDEFAPPAEPFGVDEHTLMLDHLDDVFTPDGQDAQTRAAQISGDSYELGGTPSIGCHFTNGAFGEALAIICEPRTQEEIVEEHDITHTTAWSWHESRQDPVYGWPPPLFMEVRNPDVKAYNAWLHDLGIAVAPYAAFAGIGAPSRWSKQFGPEWRREPVSTQPSEPPKGHYFLMICANSGYADYLAAGTEWLLDNFDFDGIYTDGNAHVYPCKNEHHGCGYYDTDGVHRPTWPIFATREYLKRIYRIVHRKRPERGFVVHHVSGSLFIPAISFTDVHYSGEHEYYEDLDTFRVRWQGDNVGVWTVMLGSSRHVYTSLHTMYSLLHDVAIWVQGPSGRNDMQRKFVNLWDTYERFDTASSHWIPYYEGEKGAVVPESSSVKVSTYLHEGQRALMVVGNLSDRPIETSVSLDLASMGLEGARARNALSGRPIGLEGGVLNARVMPKSFTLAWIERASTEG